ncbi:MAG TPA: hypothetical protein VHU43_03835, partial [Steroidobacteraceae bacterium]|nr:hypothetical protein [Steroidobacteraceae bacterium]
FAVIGDLLRPRGFAGLFGAAPSVALATLALTVMTQGRAYAATEARSMIAGAAAFFLYTIACVYFVGMRRLKAPVMTLSLLALWVLSACGLWAAFLR